MALALYDRVQQTGTANTTVSFTLSGSVTGYQSFSVIGNGNTTYYGATDTSGNWEVGIGTYATGGTLTRTTILASSNSGSAVTFSGTVTVFVTYPSERSVNLDGAGNVSALGTVSSGTWNGSTIPVAYGGTGVTASSGANSVMLRDANQNVSINRLNQSSTTTTAAAGTTTLTAASTFSQILNGTGGQTFKLPDATTLTNTTTFEFNNNATGVLTIVDNASGAVGTITSGGAAAIALLSNGTVGGTWDVHAYIPENVTWGTNSLALSTTVITGGTWNGGTIASGYGGTGLTTFSAANNALYSTSSSALAAGTLPIAAGGTAGTTATTAFNNLSPITTTGDLIIGTGTNTASRLGIGASTYVLTSNGTTASWSAPGGSTTLTTTSFTATSGQTTFTVTYTPALLQGVYRNGIKLDPADYTSTSGTAIILATGAITGDNIQVQYFSSLATSTAVNSISFGSTGLTPSTASTGAVTVAGTLAVANGGTGVTTSTGSGSTVLSTSPTLVTPLLGTPTSGNLANCTFPTLNQNTTGTAANVTGTVAIANGGTGLTSFTASQVHYGSFSTSSNFTYGTGLSVNGIQQIYQTGLYTVDGALSNYSSTNGVYLNGNAAGWLTLRGDGTGSNYIILHGSSYAEPNVQKYYTSSTERMRIDSSGNVGIGTSSPSSKLTVAGSSSTLGQFVSSGSACYLEMDNSGGGGYIGTTGNNLLFLTSTAGTERMRIDSSGNVKLSTAGTAIQNSSGRPMLNQTGGVLQVVNTVSTTSSSTTSTSFVSTGISATITPSSSSSKILALVSCAGDNGNTNTQINVTLYRGATNLGATSNGFAGVFNGGNRSIGDTSFMYLDSPATSSATTYTIYINTGSGSSVTLGNQSVPTSIILMEIAG